MSDCSEYRRRFLAEPTVDTPDWAEHRARCPDCREFAQSVRRFEGRLESALRIALPEAAPRAPVTSLDSRARRMPVRSWLALAASVLIGIGVAASLWIGTAASSLASDIVEHVDREPASWTNTDPVTAPALSAVLRQSHVAIDSSLSNLSYARRCEFRGHGVPHLVVRSESGPVTVMVLIHEYVAKAQPFDIGGYHGVIMPMPGHGSLAMVMRGAPVDAATFEDIARRVSTAVVYDRLG